MRDLFRALAYAEDVHAVVVTGAVGIKPKVSPEEALKNGMAMDVWRKMITAQGGDNDAPLPVAKERIEIKATASGKLLTLDAMKVGVAAWRRG